MKKIDFSIMREPLQIFDTDSIDIGRRQTIVNPDGTEGETSPTTPLYIDIPCFKCSKALICPRAKSTT